MTGFAITRMKAITVLFICLCAITAQAQKTYYINPVSGNDQQNGLSRAHAWKSFDPLQTHTLTAGDSVRIMQPGAFHSSLIFNANGDSSTPVTFSFAPGRYDIYPDHAYKIPLDISNTNDDPNTPKAIALHCKQSHYVRIVSDSALFVLRGKMIETYIDHSEHVTLKGLQFDYERPTMSEMTVLSVTDHFADVAIQKDFRYTIKDSLLTWEGEGWSYQPGWYWQVYNPVSGYVNRTNLPLKDCKYAMHNKQVRIFYPHNPGFKKGCTYQTRDVTRDCAGIFIQNSKNVVLQQIRIRFMHGMGIVSQYSENLHFDHIRVAPAPGRTSAAWADILHFSGCKGNIEISHCYLSAANDDAINIHGVHLRIISTPQPDQLLVRFMHGQTYGFPAFANGDSIDLVHAATLLPYYSAQIKTVQQLNKKDFLLTINNPLPAGIQPDDVVENSSQTPSVWIHDNYITEIPTRGILITTRRPAIIEKNTLWKTAGSAILVADDAASWFESGFVSQLRINDNQFFACGNPVISIHPENTQFAGPVHHNISILRNTFKGNVHQAVFAKSTEHLTFSGNSIYTDNADYFQQEHCTDVNIATDNNILHP